MAYVVGLLTPAEQAELLRRGWDLEPAPSALMLDPVKFPDCAGRMFMIWVDISMFNVVNGPDWDGHDPDWREPKP